MARRGGRSRIGPGPSGGGKTETGDLERALQAIASPLIAFGEGVSGAVDAVGSFTKKIGGEEADRVFSAFHNLESKLAASSLQDLGASISPGLGAAVGGARAFGGNLAATANSAQDLEDVSAQAAFNGMPLPKELQQSMFPLMRQRRESVEQARRDAADVSGSEVKKSAFGSLEALGIGPSTWKEMGRDIADAVGSVLREVLGIGGRH